MDKNSALVADKLAITYGKSATEHRHGDTRGTGAVCASVKRTKRKDRGTQKMRFNFFTIRHATEDTDAYYALVA